MTLLLIAQLLLAQGYAPVRQGLDPLSPEQEARVMLVGKNLRCAVCQGVAISDSPASMARAQLDKVRELVREGKSDEEIYAYFVARYGEWALLEPTKSGLNAVLWVAPVLLLLVGLGFIFFLSRKRADGGLEPAPVAPRAQQKPPATGPEETDDEFLKAVRADLER